MSPTRSAGRTWLAALALLAIAAAAVVLAPHPQPAAGGPPPASGEPVTSTLLGCPALRADSPGGRTTYGVGSAKLPGLGSTGAIGVEPTGKVPTRGRTVAEPAPAGQGLAVQGSAGLAQGLFAWRVDEGKALAWLRCGAPRASWWFTGAGASIDHESTLVLTNLDAGPAVVDLDVFGPDGPVDVSASGGRGITIGPDEHVTVPMIELAPQTDQLAVHVRASQGRVVAAMRDRFARSATATPGEEWLSGTAGPARVVRLAGAPGLAVRRTLVVANPGDSVAPLEIEVASRNGRSIADGLTNLRVEPGSVTTINLSPILRGEPLAVIVHAARPVVASVRMTTGSGDEVVAGPALPLTGPAVAPIVGRTTLHLIGGPNPSRSTVEVFDSAGAKLEEQTVDLDANTLVDKPVPSGAAYAVITPTEGMPFGAAIAVIRTRASAQPLAELPLLVRVPGVRPAG